MVIELSANIGIKNITELYDNIRSAIDNGCEIILDFSKVKRIDLSVLQVLLVANKRAMQNNKELKFRSLSEQVKKQLMLGGMQNLPDTPD